MRFRQILVALFSITNVFNSTAQKDFIRSCHLRSFVGLVCFLLTVITATSAQDSQLGMASVRGKPVGSAVYLSLPLSFEANQGQTDPRVNYLSRASAYTLLLTSEEAVLRLRGRAEEDGAVLHMRLLGVNGRADAKGRDELPGKANYFIGRDPAKWHTNVPMYGKVEYNGIYPGVDLVYYGNQGQLEYDFAVSPGADPNSIAIQFDGSTVEINAAGDLVLHTDGNEVRFNRPVAYQSIPGGEQNEDNNKRFINSRFVLRGANRVAFELGPYDHSRPLVIDPVLVYSTYFGGSFPDEPFGITVDSSGAAYVSGATCSADFPVTAGAYQTSHNGSGGVCMGPQTSFEDVFVTKFNPAGTGLVYSTYIGGSQSDRGYDIAVDSSGSAYIAGQTQSKDYPVTAGAFITTCPGGVNGCNTGIVTKLNPTGSALVYSTYLGGSNNMGSTGIAVNSSGEAYTTGATDGTFPTTAGAYQASNPRNGAGLTPVFAVLNASGTACVYCTFLGGMQGTSYNPGSQAFGVGIDSSGKAYITGWTDSPDFPTTPGAFKRTCGTDLNCNGLWDAFVAKLDPTQSGPASLVFSTFLGGSGTDIGLGVAVDAAGNAYVSGITGANVNTNFVGSPLPSKDFPTTAGSFQTTCPGTCTFDSAWVAKLNSTGSILVYSTYLGGGNGNTSIGFNRSIGVDPALNAYVTGSTAATDFPTKNPIQATNGGGFDAFVTTLDPNGSALVFSTYLGGSSADGAVSIALDQYANMYVTGGTSSPNFPVSAGAFQTTCPGSCTYSHGFVAKIGRFYSSTSLSSSLNPSMFGQSVTLTATVNLAAMVKSASATAIPTGTVTFTDGTTTLGTGRLSNGSATFTTSALNTDTHSITASYNGDSNFLSSTSAALAQVVNKDTSNTSVASSVNPSEWEATVTFTATVKTTTGKIPTGAVTFKNGATTLGTGTLSSGRETFSTRNLAVGSHSITVVYSGDADTLSSTSSALTQTVNKAVTTATVTATPNPSQFNQPVALKATVKSATGAIPSGNVTFKDGSTTLGTVTLASGAATLSVSKLTVGAHSITAVYAGGADFAANTSPAVAHTVNKAVTTTTVTATVNPSQFNQPVALKATVKSATGAIPSGSVTFKDGSITLGTVTLASGAATLSVSKLTVGAHSITAVYGGGADFTANTSPAVTHTVNKAVTTTALTSTLNPSNSGQSVTFIATVKETFGGNPSGTVTFKDGTTTIGTGAVSTTTHQAKFVTTKLSIGTHNITAAYGGDAHYLTSASTVVKQVVK